MLPFIDAPFAALSSSLGASTDEIKLIFSFLLSYPLAGLLKRIPDDKPYQKNLFIILVSCFYLVGLFDLWDGVRTLLISSAGAYAIAHYIDGGFMPWIGFVFLMGHMSVNHIHRKYNGDPRLIDITGAQMVLVMKLTAFCWNVHDGRLPEKTLSDFQKQHAVRELPGVLDYAAYVLFFPSLMAGPAFDYVEYQRWIETSMFQLPPGTDPAKAPPTRKKRKIPRSGTPATIKGAYGLIWLGVFLFLSGHYDPNSLASDEYAEYNLLRRIWIMHVTMFAVRTKYYAVWFLAEGSCILSGIGYRGINPTTGKADWDRLRNVNPLKLEFAQSSHAYLGNWNINTNNWLRSYMYLRVTPKGKKPGFRASMATFVTSAFWHGFEPGYYMTFVLGAFLQTTAKNTRRYIRPFFLHPTTSKPTPLKRYYDITSYLTTQLAFSFAVTPFVLLTFPSSLAAWTHVNFYCIAGVAISLAFFASPAKPWIRKRQQKRAAAYGVTAKPPPVAVKPVLSEPPPTAKPEEADTTGADGGRTIPPALADLKRTISMGSAGAGALTPQTTPGTPRGGDEVRYDELRDKESLRHGPALGLPDDPGKDLDEIMDELRREVEERRRKGMSIGEGLREAVNEKVGAAGDLVGEFREETGVDVGKKKKK
ncbi:MAG: lysophospholipid acyltransferase [Alyxoria varia]|nr:MAG: lysophospholipid acyltransferase [Alyxoria varia]